MLTLIALVISLAALVVACTSLYLTTLAPANIELDHISRRRELGAGSFSGSQPQSNMVELAFFLSNTGARGGLLEYASIEDATIAGGSHTFWTEIDQTRGPLPHADGHMPELEAIALEGGDVQAIFFYVSLRQRGGSEEEQARQIRDLRSVTVEVEWAFFRTRRFSLVRGRRQRIVRTVLIEVDARAYRDETIKHWKDSPPHHRLVEIAEGRAEPEPMNT